MIRNDYRRSLIMLRGLAKGYSGHVRLERRTLGGIMQFTVNGAAGDAPLFAVALGERNGNWYAVTLGQLGRYRRDQAGLNVNFDPRDIQGRELEEYDLIGVARPGEPNNPLVLSGFLNGSREVNWSRACAVCADLFGTSAACEEITALPDEEIGESTEIEQLVVEVEIGQPVAEVEIGQPVVEVEIGQQVAEVEIGQPVVEVFGQQVAEVEIEQPVVEVEIEQPAIEVFEQSVTEGLVQPAEIGQTAAPADRETEQQPEPTPSLHTVEFNVAPGAKPGTPGEGSALGTNLDPDQPWPESILALRALFEQNPPFEPFPAPGYVFVRVPMLAGDGDSYCAIGLKSENGAYTVLCYAVPGSFALEPPPGMEGYSWRGTGNIGWWTTCIDLLTGEPFEGDDP